MAPTITTERKRTLTTIEETLTKLIELKLTSMAHAVRELMDTAPGHQMSFERSWPGCRSRMDRP